MNYKIMSMLLSLSMIGCLFANATKRDPRIAELEMILQPFCRQFKHKLLTASIAGQASFTLLIFGLQD